MVSTTAPSLSSPMSPADRAAFGALVHPLKPWSEDGSVWGIAIQGGVLTDDPAICTPEGEPLDWTEVRLERWVTTKEWSLWYCPESEGTSGWEVYQGELPDRALFEDVVRNGRGVAAVAEQMLGSAVSSRLGCGHDDGYLSIYPRSDGSTQCTECANVMRGYGL